MRNPFDMVELEEDPAVNPFDAVDLDAAPEAPQGPTVSGSTLTQLPGAALTGTRPEDSEVPPEDPRGRIGVAEHFKRFVGGKGALKKLPVLGMAAEFADIAATKDAANRALWGERQLEIKQARIAEIQPLLADTRRPGYAIEQEALQQELSGLESDVASLPAFIAANRKIVEQPQALRKEQAERGMTVGAAALEGVSELPAYMGEFVMTGVAGRAGRAGARTAQAAALRTARHMAPGVARQATVGGIKAAGALARPAAAGIARTVHPLGLLRTAEEYGQRRLDKTIRVENGRVVVDKNAGGEWADAWRAFASTAIENATEELGVEIAPVARRALSKTPGLGRVMKALSARAAKKNTTLAKAIEATGFNGFIGEWLEEDAAGFLHAVADTEKSDKPVIDRMGDFLASNFDARNMAVRALVLAVPTIGAQGLGAMQQQGADKAVAEQDKSQTDKTSLAEVAQAPAEEVAPAAVEPAATPRSEADWLKEFTQVNRRVTAAEKNGPLPPGLESWTPEADWEKWSKARGYTDAEIADFRRFLELVEEGKRLGWSDDDLASITHQRSVEPAAQKQPWEMTQEEYYRTLHDTKGPEVSNKRVSPSWDDVKRETGINFKVGIDHTVRPVLKGGRDPSASFTPEQELALKQAFESAGFSIDRHYRYKPGYPRDLEPGQGFRVITPGTFPTNTEHFRAVRQAIHDGHAVPRAVLEGYRGQPWADAALAKMEAAARPSETTNEFGLTRKEQADLDRLSAKRDDRTKALTSREISRLRNLEAKASAAFEEQNRRAAHEAYNRSVAASAGGKWRNAEAAADYAKMGGIPVGQVVSDLASQGYTAQDVRAYVRHTFGDEATDAALAKMEGPQAPAPAVPVEQAKPKQARKAGVAELDFEAASGQRRKISVRTAAFADLPPEVQERARRELAYALRSYGTSRLPADKKAIEKWTRVVNGKGRVTLVENRHGEEVSYSLSDRTVKEEFADWSRRGDLYDVKFSASGQQLADEIAAEDKAKEEAEQAQEEENRKAREEAYKDRLRVQGEAEVLLGKTKWKKHTITTVLEGGGAGEQATGWTHGGLTAHRDPYADKWTKLPWKVTHNATGLGLGTYATQKEARVVAARFAQHGFPADATIAQLKAMPKDRMRLFGAIARDAYATVAPAPQPAETAQLPAYQPKPGEDAPGTIDPGTTGSTQAKFAADPAQAQPVDTAGRGGFAALPGAGPRPTVAQPSLTTQETQSQDAGIESFFGRTNRLTSVKTKVQQAVAKVRQGLAERFKFLWRIPRTPDTILARDAIRTMPEQARAAHHRAIEDVQAYIDGDGSRQALDPAGLDLLRRKVFTEDLLSEAERAKVEERDTSERLPEGVTEESLLAERKRLDGLIDKVPSVKDAYAKRQELWKEVSADLAERGVISEEDAANPTYVRHFVLNYLDDGSFMGFGRKKLTKPYRPYARRRKGTSLDISTDFLEVELKALTDIYRHNAIEDMAQSIADNYAVKPDENGKAPPGYVEWQYQRGNVMYRAKTIAEAKLLAVVGDAMNDPAMAADMKIPLSALRDGLVMGGKRKTYLVPDWLAETLNDLPVNWRGGTVVSFTEPGGQLWKRWILRINPFRYNSRNLVGDGERVVAAGREKAFLRVPEAVKLLWNQQGEVYEKAMDYGAIGSSLWHEMGGAHEIPEFERFKTVRSAEGWRKVAALMKIPVRTVQGVGQAVQDVTQAREDVLRMAVYLDVLAEIEAGKPVRHWVGSAADIAALAKIDKYRAAAKVSRETLGDYGNFTPWENSRLRNGLIYFYSWMRINTTFWPRVTYNAAREGAAGKPLAVAGLRVGWNVGKWLFRINLAYAALAAWNHGDDERRRREKALPWYIRVRPHLIIAGGVVHTPSALTDFLEWFGLDKIGPDLRRWENRQITTRELVINIMKTEAKAPVNRIYQALNPFLKTPISLTGTRTYPDVFEAAPFAEAWSDKAISRTILDILGADTKRFVDMGDGKRTPREVFSYYFSGSAYTPMSPEDLERQLIERLDKSLLRSPSGGRAAGEARQGREREVDDLRNRLQALTGQGGNLWAPTAEKKAQAQAKQAKTAARTDDQKLASAVHDLAGASVSAPEAQRIIDRLARQGIDLMTAERLLRDYHFKYSAPIRGSGMAARKDAYRQNLARLRAAYKTQTTAEKGQ